MTETQKTFLMTGIVCASAASVVLGVGVRDAVDLGLTRSGADTVASKQLLASRAVQTEIPEGEYFDQLAGLLKREFVDPIDDDLMLASGAIRGMVLSLQDPTTIYMDAKDLPRLPEGIKRPIRGNRRGTRVRNAAHGGTSANSRGRRSARGTRRPRG
ncbi:MAG: hypothetical protein M5U21_06540 [Fimbriimonadaceae bacterium]|nr:hypothetical protein [Fimbriimonadaceae bacterium]